VKLKKALVYALPRQHTLVSATQEVARINLWWWLTRTTRRTTSRQTFGHIDNTERPIWGCCFDMGYTGLYRRHATT